MRRVTTVLTIKEYQSDVLDTVQQERRRQLLLQTGLKGALRGALCALMVAWLVV